MDDKEKLKLIIDTLGKLIPGYNLFRSSIFGYIDYNMTEENAGMFLDQLFTAIESIK